MKETLLFQTINTLDKREIREIKKFLASPYFNQREDVQLLFAFLADTKPKNTPSKEQTFFKMFPLEKKYDDHKVRLASSLLLQLIENFWAAEDAKNDNSKNKRIAAAQYRLRNMEKHFLRVFDEAKQVTENQSLRNANYHFDQYELELEGYRFDSAVRKESERLESISKHLDYAYYSLKLRQACLAANYQNVYKAIHEQSMIAEIIAHVERNHLDKIPSVGVYYFAFKSLSEPENTSNFFSLKTLLFEFGNAFPPDEARDLYLIGINYCIKKHNSGEADFLKPELELYQKGLKNRHLYINNFITKFTYRNVVTLALTLQEYDWAESFIEDYKNELEPSHREGNYKHCLARLAYEQQNYGKVLELLQEADYEDMLINLAAKALLLKALYETSADDALDAHLEAMRVYIKRKSQIAYHKENYLNLITFTKRLLSTDTKQHEKIVQLELDIQNTKVIAEKKWLLAKLEEIK